MFIFFNRKEKPLLKLFIQIPPTCLKLVVYVRASQTTFILWYWLVILKYVPSQSLRFDFLWWQFEWTNLSSSSKKKQNCYTN